MLSISLPLGSTFGAWRFDGGCWRSGAAVVAPYRHPRLEAFARASPTRTLFVVRERLAGAPPFPPDATGSEAAIEELRVSMREWPLDYLLLQVPAAPGPCMAEAGRWGTAPLYLVSARHGLEADWDPAKLYPHLRQGMDFQRAVHCLVNLGYPYSRRTLFPDMWHLTERATATWDSRTGALDVAYPRALDWPPRRRLRPDADVLEAFERRLARALGRWFDLPREPIAAELSGGLDSTAAAIVAAKISPFPVRTYGLIMPGDNGVHQSGRRDEVVASWKMDDTTFLTESFAPFAPPSTRLTDRTIVPWGEYYDELVGAMLARMRADGVQTVITGMGGDEISTLRYSELYATQDGLAAEAAALAAAEEEELERSELPDFLSERALEAFHHAVDLDEAPSGAIEASCYESAQAGAPVYLRSGIWPVSPYCDPEVVELVRLLPFEWRYGRRLQRDYLRAAGCSEAVANPAVTESFRPIMSRALRVDSAHRLRELFRSPRLADLGLVDGHALPRSYEAFVAQGGAGREDWFMEAATLEAALRALG
jgi:asparagine synthase (glutamine-hydrolysing)